MADGLLDMGATSGTTWVSVPGNPPNQSAAGAAGSGGPGSNMATHQAAMLLIFSSLAALVAIGYVFRRGPID